MCFNNVRIQNYIPFKAYGVRKLAHFYYDSRISVREKKIFSLFISVVIAPSTESSTKTRYMLLLLLEGLK